MPKDPRKEKLEKILRHMEGQESKKQRLLKMLKEALLNEDPSRRPQGGQGELPFGNKQDSQTDGAPWDYGDDLHRGYDDLLSNLETQLTSVALSIIDEYKDHPEFGSSEASDVVRSEILSSVHIFFDSILEKILDEEF